MKKNIYTSNITDEIIKEDNFELIILEIINDVMKRKRDIHLKYQKLVKKVLVSTKSIRRKTILSKYILYRVIRESDRAYNDGQSMAKRLCPICKKNFFNQENFSKKLH